MSGVTDLAFAPVVPREGKPLGQMSGVTYLEFAPVVPREDKPPRLPLGSGRNLVFTLHAFLDPGGKC